MATITKTLQVLGSVMSSPAAATVLLNGVEVYSGQIGVGQPIDVPGSELFALEYQGNEDTVDTLALSISVTSGVAKIGMTQILNNENHWINPNNANDDGRTQILINGLPPEWPATPVEPMPGGNADNPDWAGWCFDVSAGETMTYEFEAPAFNQPAGPTTP